MSLIVLLLLPFLGSCLAALLPHNARNTESLLAGLVALVGTIQVALLYPQIAHGGVIREEFMWLPSLGLNFVLRMDGFAWLFSMLVLGIGTLVSLYARYYMSPDDPVPRFFAFFLAFMGAMLGLVISGNLIQIVFFWELTSLFSFLLIGYWHHRADARRGAYMALMVTGAGGLCLLAGVMLLGHIVGSYDLDLVLAAGDQIRAHSLYPVMLALVLIGALSKSAQFPFHFWLPHAMAAPTPVSAYLHSATMVKAGVFLLARLWPSLSGSEEWFYIVGGAGAITLLLGAYCAIFQNDLKGLLAYSTISHLGLITLLLGLNSPLAAVAAVFHILNHATFKASLFMAAGIIDHESGTRDIRKLSGLVRLIPFTATLAMVASASMAGVPLLNGFLSKEMFFAETVFISSTAWVEFALPVIATVAGTFSVVYALRFTVDVFFGPTATNLPHTPHEPPRWMRAPVELLVFTCLLVGIFPAQVVGSILAAAALPVVGGVLPEYSLAIWHGWNAPMIMSLVAMSCGVVLYLILRKQLKRGRFKYPPLISYFNGKRGFERCLVVMMRGVRKIEKRISTKRLQTQLFLLVLAAVIAGVIPMLHSGLSWGDRPKIPGSIVFVTLWLLAIACALGAAWQAKYHRLAALTMVSVCGLMTCITFVWFSAPDLALTQLVVEVVTTVLILLGLRWLPRRIEEVSPLPSSLRKARIRRLRDFLLSTVVGGGMALLSYAMLTRQTPNDISSFYLSRALPEGGGSNVVNVMLVGLDDLRNRAVGSGLVKSQMGRDHRTQGHSHAIERHAATGGSALAKAVPAVDHAQALGITLDEGNERLVFFVIAHRGHDMGEQRAGAVELLTVDLRGVAVEANLGIEGAGVLALGFGERVAETVAGQDFAEVVTLLLLGGGLQQDVHHAQVVLRNLPQGRVGGGDQLDHLGHRYIGHLGATVGFGNGDAPQATGGKFVKLGHR